MAECWDAALLPRDGADLDLRGPRLLLLLVFMVCDAADVADVAPGQLRQAGNVLDGARDACSA
jgi:hypothetical protein